MDPRPGKRKEKYSKFATWFVSKILSQYLGKYLQNFAQNQVQANFGANSQINLTNIRLRVDALQQLRLPITVLPSSIVESLQCQIQLRYTQSSVKINLKGIRVMVRPNSSEWTGQKWSQFKQRKLKDWQKAQQGKFKQIDPKNIWRRKLNILLNNINVSIQNLVIYFECYQPLGYPTSLRISVQSLQLNTTNSDWIPKHSTNLMQTFRLVSVQGLSVALQCQPPQIPFDYSQQDFRKMKFSQRHYMLKPTNLQVKYRVNNQSQPSQSIHQIQVYVNSLNISVNELQVHYLQATMELVAHKNKFNQYDQMRPIGRPIENPSGWWTFIIKAARQDMRMNMLGIFKMKQERDSYIQAYKRVQKIIHAPWLPSQDQKTQEIIRKTEQRYRLEEIINFRTLALYQLRIQAMAYVKARGNVMGETHLGDLWDYYLNDFQSLMGNSMIDVAKQHDIQLNLVQKDELSQLINMDSLKIVDSYLNGQSSDIEDMFISFSFKIHRTTIQMIKTQVGKPAKFLVPYAGHCSCRSCKFRSGIQALPDPKIIEAERTESVFNSETSDKIYNITMNGSDGKVIDSKLVREETLLVVEMDRIKGAFQCRRNLQIEEQKPIEIHDFLVFDPSIFVYYQKNFEIFKEMYNYSKGKTLIESVILQSFNNTNIAYALKFFFMDIEMYNELEFLIHYYRVFIHQPQTLCICGKKYENKQIFVQKFAFKDSQTHLHLPDEMQKEIQNQIFQQDYTLIAELYDLLKKYINKKIMGHFLACNFRWIGPLKAQQRKLSKKSLIQGERNSSTIKADIQIQGKPSPLLVKFIDKHKTKQEEVSFEVQTVKNWLNLNCMPMEIALTTSVVSKLINWYFYKPPPGKFKQLSMGNNFISALKSQSKSIMNVQKIILNSTKNPQHLYWLFKQSVAQNGQMHILLKCSSISILLIQSTFKQKKKFNQTLLEVNSFSFESKPEDQEHNEIETRSNFLRDKKFYSQMSIKTGRVFMKSVESTLIETSISLDIKQCILQAHPYIPDLIVDLNVDYLEISVYNKLLSIIGLLSTINIPKNTTKPSREVIKRIKLQQRIFRIDKRILKHRLETLQNKHYTGPLKKCIHCILQNRKLIKKISISVGKRPAKSKPHISINVLSADASKVLIKLQSELFLCTIQERPFQQFIRVYSTVIKTNSSDKHSQILVQPYPLQDADLYQQSPVFFPADFYACPKTTKASGLFSTQNLNPLFLILKSEKSTNTDIFDIKIWKQRISVLKELYKMKSKRHSPILQPSSTNIPTSVNNNWMNIHISDISIRLFEKLDESYFIKGLLKTINLIKLLQAYQKNQLPQNTAQAEQPVLEVNFTCNSVSLSIQINQKLLECHIGNLKYKKFPGTKTSVNSKRKQHREAGVIPDFGFWGKDTYKKQTISYIQSVTIQSFKVNLPSILQISAALARISILSSSEQQLVLRKNILYKVKQGVVTSTTQGEITELSVWTDQPVFLVPASLQEELQRIYSLKAFSFSIKNSIQLSKSTFRSNEQISLSFFPAGLILSLDSIPSIYQKISEIFNLRRLDQLNLQNEDLKFFQRVDIDYIQFSSLKINTREVSVRVHFKEESLFSAQLGGTELLLQEGLGTPKIMSGLARKLSINPEKTIHHQLVFQNDTPGIDFQFQCSFDPIILSLKLSGIQIFFLNRVIQEISSAFQQTLAVLQSQQAQKQSNQFILNIILENSQIFIPKNSWSKECVGVYLEEGSASIKQGKSKWEIPPSFIMQPQDSTQIQRVVQIDSTLIQIKTDLIQGFLSYKTKKIQVAKLGAADLLVTIPATKKSYSNWKLKTKIEGDVHNINLKSSVSSLLLLSQMIKGNVDQQAKVKQKKLSSKNTKISIKVRKSQGVVRRWITMPPFAVQEDFPFEVKSREASQDSPIKVDDEDLPKEPKTKKKVSFSDV